MFQRGIQVPYAGVHTFARAPQKAISDLKAGDVAVLGVPHDGTSSSRQGVRLGPRGIREASVDFIYGVQSAGTVVDVLTGHTLTWSDNPNLADLGDLAVYPTDLPRTEDTLRETLGTIAGQGAFPVILGGDHYITYPLFQGFAEAMKSQGKKAGLIQLASGLDLGDQHPLWGGSWHGATLRRLVESKALAAENIAWLGVHGFLPYAEWEMARTSGATVVTTQSLRKQGMANSARQAIEAAGRGCDAIYISLDIGIVDSGYAPGRGDVVVGGLVPEELLDLMRALQDPKVVALDVVEVAPPIDPAGRTTRLAAEAIIEFIAPKAFA
jgi:agmatinase